MKSGEDMRNVDFAIEQSKVALMESMGEELGFIYEALCNEVAWVHHKWSEYVVLFRAQKNPVLTC